MRIRFLLSAVAATGMLLFAFSATQAHHAFSGEFDFIDTTYVFPITHMVAPKDQSLSCTECHSKSDSRLKDLKGFYMPGRDGSKVLNYAGWGVVLASLMGAVRNSKLAPSSLASLISIFSAGISFSVLR